MTELKQILTEKKIKSCFPTNIIKHGAGNPQNAPGDEILTSISRFNKEKPAIG